jgi:hypothetical protein
MSKPPRFSQHAMERWVLRCKYHDPDEEWSRSRRINAKRLARITGHSGHSSAHPPGSQYRLSPNGVIFVVRCGVIVTVWAIRTA